MPETLSATLVILAPGGDQGTCKQKKTFWPLDVNFLEVEVKTIVHSNAKMKPFINTFLP